MKLWLLKIINNIKSIFILNKIIIQYSDIVNREYFIKIIDNDMKKIDNIFNDSEIYDFNYRILKINELRKSIDELKKRNDYILMRRGYHIQDILDHYKKEQLFIIVSSIQYLNPLYDIIKLDISSNKLTLTIDSIANINIMIDILNNIYHNDYVISYTVEKIYSKNRVGYKVIIESSKLYIALKYFLSELNKNIYEYIEPILKSLTEYQKRTFYSYIDKFSIEGDVLKSLTFGNKEEILSILQSYRDLIEVIGNKLREVDV